MQKRLLICDLDNTLYDWVSYFVPSFYAMMEEAIKITGIDQNQLLDDFKVVHQLHHDAEHPFALLETKSVQELYCGRSRQEIAKILDPAFHAFNSARNANLKLYPGVFDSLRTLSGDGWLLIAHTESKLHAVADRLHRLGLINFFTRIYCRERANSLHPDPKIHSVWFNRFPLDKVIELSHHQRKPDPDTLLEICASEGIQPSSAAYVGDSIARDILMAKMAGVTSVWAKYGVISDENMYRKLVRITHWTDEDVQRERELKLISQDITPDFTLENSFDEIIPILEEALLVNADYS